MVASGALPLAPTASASFPQACLPLPLTSFLGRERELAAVATLLRRREVRLLTLTGPGGVGKTRLAIAVANSLACEFSDGAAFVALAPVHSAELVASAISRALGVVAAADEQDHGPLVAALQRVELLLLLDNFEHVVTAAPLVGELLVGCPRLTVLVTSRAALHVSGEHEYPVLPLSLPASDTPLAKHIARAPAVRLFVERATAVDPKFTLTDDNAAAIAAICDRLDGLPLAIELAAARSKLLSPALLLPRLSRRLPLLTGGPRDVPARLQTVREAISWSHELLTSQEQALFRHLAVFVGGFTLDAAEIVCGNIGEALEPTGTPAISILDGVASLLDKSLLQVSERGAGEQRLGILETIREFALERLDAAGEGEVARAAHAAYFMAFSEAGYPNHFGPFTDIDRRLEHLEAEIPNIRAAFTYLADAGDAEGVLRLAGALAVFWQLRSHFREGQQWLEWGLSRTAEAQTDARCRALVGYGLLRCVQGDHEQAAPLVRAALSIAERIEDTEIIAHAIHMLGLIAEWQQSWEEAERLLEQALGLWRGLDAWAEEAVTLMLLSGVAFSRGNSDLAARHAEASLTHFRGLGYASGTGTALCRLAQLARERGDDHEAALTYREALQLWAGVRDRWFITFALAGLAELASAHGQAESAATLLGSIDALAAATGAPLFYTARINADRAHMAAQTALGAARVAALRADGHTLRLDEAVALALAISVPAPSSVTANTLHARSGASCLTPRETEVLRLLVAGHTDREIAAKLFIGHRTVQDHVSHILGKLGVVNRTEAATVAQRDGLVQP